MASTYRAVEISSPGVFSLVERKVAVPGAGQVRIRVEACGVCHSDAATVEAQFPNLSYPRVPGHEVIGRIEEVGPGVTTWKVGQRVGVGFSEVKTEPARPAAVVKPPIAKMQL
jgi:alcohol dehydrogenase, propanol-preferring